MTIRSPRSIHLPMAGRTTIDLHRGQLLLEWGHFDDAIAAFDAVLATQPDDVDALYGRALALERVDALDAAVETCERALSVDPDHLPTLLTKGSLHARRGERMTARECFWRVTKLAPALAAGHHLLASVGGKGFTAPLRSEVVELFDGCADRFDKLLVEGLAYRGHQVLPETVKRAAGRHLADWTVVDLGCGTGLCGPELRPLARSLVGVDVSPRIVERARQSGVYDAVFVADLVYAMTCMATATIDLYVSADVFGYIGDLAPVFDEARRTLRPGGRLAFTVEALDGDRDLVMGSSRRIAFNQAYLRRLADERGLAFEALETVPLRREASGEVVGHVVVLQR